MGSCKKTIGPVHRRREERLIAWKLGIRDATWRKIVWRFQGMLNLRGSSQFDVAGMEIVPPESGHQTQNNAMISFVAQPRRSLLPAMRAGSAR
jgi:hypothetical protein